MGRSLLGWVFAFSALGVTAAADENLSFPVQGLSAPEVTAVDLQPKRTPSKFAPVYDGHNFQDKFIIEARNYLEDAGYDRVGDEPLAPLEFENDQAYRQRLFFMMQGILDLDLSDNADQEAIQSGIIDIISQAPFMRSNCYGYAVDANHVRIPDPGDGSRSVLLDFQSLDFSYKAAYLEDIRHIHKDVSADRLIPADLDENGYPIPKNGVDVSDSYYIVAIYTDNSEEHRDYHWVMENQVGWSSQEGMQNIVNHYSDIEWPHLELDFPSYEFAGYFYVPAERIDVGFEVNQDLAWQTRVYASQHPEYWQLNGIDNIYDPRAFENMPFSHGP